LYGVKIITPDELGELMTDEMKGSVTAGAGEDSGSR
jgi:hypothetical protein